MADLDVVARLRLFTGNAQRRLTRVSNALDGLNKRAKHADSYMTRFVKRAAALGAMYVSFRAISGALHSVVGGAFEFQSSIEQTKIGLQTMIKNIEKVSFDRAAEGADYLWRRLQLLSVQSVATTKELHEAFAGSYGPMRAAGAEMDDILNTSRNLVHAAGALGIDMPQAIRDLGLMATGRAMAQVKLFQRLRTSGFLQGKGGGMMSAEEWNKLAAPERTQRLIDVLSKFEEAGGAAAKTLSGRLSTLLDIYQNIRAGLFEAVFGKFADSLGELNKWLLVNYSRMEAYFSGLGNRLRKAVGPAFDWLGKRLTYFGDNFELIIDTWIQKVGNFISALRSMVPVFTKLAGAWIMLSAARGAVGLGAAVGSKVMGAGAIALGGAKAGGGIGGAFSALLGALVPLAGVAFAVAGAFALISSLFIAFRINTEALGTVFAALQPLFSSVVSLLGEVFGYMWSFAYDILGTLGTLILPPLIMAGQKLLEWFKTYLEYVKLGWQIMAESARKMREWAVNAFGDWVAEEFKAPPSSLQRTGIPEIKEPENIFKDKTPGARAQVVNDFRGSKITLKQEFRQADPDRVAIQMMKDLARFAEQRVTSGFVPATTG
jgi:hypothetical protein